MWAKAETIVVVLGLGGAVNDSNRFTVAVPLFVLAVASLLVAAALTVLAAAVKGFIPVLEQLLFVVGVGVGVGCTCRNSHASPFIHAPIL